MLYKINYLKKIIKKNKILLEEIKYKFNLYNYDEFIKIESVTTILNSLKKNRIKLDDENLLDLGGGNGLFAYRLKRRGLKTSITVNDNYSFQEYGFLNIKSNIEDIAEEKKYEIITCLLVLELVENRLKVIEKIKNLMSADGVCYISLPNPNAVNIMIWRDRAKKQSSGLSRQFYDNQNLFSMDTLKDELNQYGLIIIEEFKMGFLPIYACDSSVRILKKYYINLNKQLKGYLPPSYILLRVERSK